MKQTIALLILAVFFSGCSSTEPTESHAAIGNAHWRGVLETPGGDLPFDFYTVKYDSGYGIEIKNGSEKLLIKDGRVTADSVIFPGHIFDSEIRAKIINDSVLEGEFVRLDTETPYSIPFSAMKGYHKRFFDNPDPVTFDFTGKWEVDFIHEGDSSIAQGVFSQNGNEIIGTFLTPTGDYRFLSGQVNGKTMYLSTFDGSHAFLFKGTGSVENKITGGFWSGNHWFEKWVAVRNDSFTLPDADTITHFKEGETELKFTYINEAGEKVMRDRDSFIGKVTIVQILGTWCPNCMDETNFYVQLDGKFENVEIIGLAFEKAKDMKFVNKRIERVKKKLKVKYPIYYMGAADKVIASEAFPMLNNITSFPTSIIIDKKGNVRKIHTGFTGPGTGKVYHKYTEEFNRLIYDLDKE